MTSQNNTNKYPEDGLNLVRIGGLDYCKPHKLEACGKCRYDFSLTNAMQEFYALHQNDPIELTEIVNEAEERVRKDKREGRAPRRAHGDQPVLPRAPEQSEVDLSVCPFWTNGGPELVNAFQSTLSVVEAFTINNAFDSSGVLQHGSTTGLHEIGLDALVKYMFVGVASTYERYMASNNDESRIGGDPNDCYGRLVIQENEAHSEGIIVDVLSALNAPKSHRSLFSSAKQEGGDADSPLLVVRYAYSTVGTPKEQIRVLFDMLAPSQHRGMSFRDVDARTVRRVRDILEQNRKELDSSWLQSKERDLPESMRVSVIVPLVDAEYKAALDENVCPGCGREATLNCSRCSKQKYCSRDCQKGHWPMHRKICTPKKKTASSNETPSGRTASVNISQTGVPSGMHSSIFSLRNPTGSASVRNESNAAVSAPEGVFAIKIQVGMFGFSQMQVYNRTRSFQCSIFEGNCAQAREIDSIIRRNGEAGGLKGYFNATIRDGKLVIFLDTLLGLLPW